MVLRTVTPEATQSKKNGCQFQRRTCLMPGQLNLKLHITTGKNQAMLRALYAAFLTQGIKKLVGISAVSVLITAKLCPQRGGDTKRQEGASWQKKTQLAVQLDSTVGISLCCTSTRSLASCSDINHDFESFSNNSLINYPCLTQFFSFSIKSDLELRQTGKEMIQKINQEIQIFH